MILKQAFIMNESTMMFRDVSGWIYMVRRRIAQHLATDPHPFFHLYICGRSRARLRKHARRDNFEKEPRVSILKEGGSSLHGSSRLHRLGICINWHIHRHASP